MESKRVYVTRQRRFADAINKIIPDVEVLFFESPDQVNDTENVEILLATQQDAGILLKRFPNIKWCQCISAGVDSLLNYIHKENIRSNAIISRFGGYLNRSMAEWVIARMISHERKFADQFRDQENNHWNDTAYKEYRCLFQLTIGIIGIGNIGREVAKRCKQFDMKVLGVGRRQLDPSDVPKCVDLYRSVQNMEEVLQQSDYICSVLPHTPETAGLFDGEVLKACSSKKSIFINVGRGSAVSTETILHALETGWISHVILDVSEVEPLPSDSPLWNHPQVTLSPHVSALTRAHEVAYLFAQNYDLYLRGEKLKFVVDMDRGY